VSVSVLWRTYGLKDSRAFECCQVGQSKDLGRSSLIIISLLSSPLGVVNNNNIVTDTHTYTQP